MRFITVVPGIKDAVAGSVVLVNHHIFGMHVENRAGQRANGQNRIHALPKQMARIVVDAYFWTNRFTQTQQGIDVVYAEARVQL